MNKYILLFTIGPVQSFIAQARKTQDLYAGSNILSDLIDFAIKDLVNKGALNISEDEKDNLIFPAYGIKSKPNRFLAIVTTDDMQTLGNDLKTAVGDHFIDTMSSKVVALLPPQSPPKQNQAEKQLRDFLKVYWTALPLNDDWENNYASKVQEIERLMGAVKNVRYFNQFAERGRKCGVNGEYNVLFYRKTKREDSKSDLALRKQKFLFDEEIQLYDSKYSGSRITLKYIQEGEGLCAVSMAKRLYETDYGFPSVAYIALMETLRKAYCLEDMKQNAFKECAEFVSLISKKEEPEYQFFYEENQTKKKLEEAGIKGDRKQEDFDKAFQRLKIKLDEKGLNRSKYYAILLFDADSMGKKLAKCKNPEEHQNFSKLLGDFASQARELVDKKNYGKTVYAGGDDFLGFLNLNYLFDAIWELRELFECVVNKKKGEKGLDHLGDFTFSAGVSIAHYKTPLSEVLNWARKMEKEAKSIDGIKKNEIPKNAIAIAAVKRSGEVHKTLWKWQYDELIVSKIAKDLTYAIRNGELSRKFINTLSSTFNNLMSTNGELAIVSDKLVQMELSRLMKRQTKDVKGTDLDSLAKNLYNLYVASKTLHQGTLQNFFNLLHICEFVNRSLNQPIPEPETALA